MQRKYVDIDLDKIVDYKTEYESIVKKPKIVE